MAARTVPTVPVFLAGQKLTATILNQISLWEAFWSNPPMFRMRQTAAQSIPNAANTVVTMDALEYDTDSGRAAGTPWAYTIPPGMTGRWQFIVHIPMSASAANEHDVYLFKNGSAVVGSQQTNNTGAINSQMTGLTIPCNAGDVMTAAIFQQTGGAVNTFVATNIMPTFEGVLRSLATP